MPKNTKIDRLSRRVADSKAKMEQAATPERRKHREKIFVQRSRILTRALEHRGQSTVAAMAARKQRRRREMKLVCQNTYATPPPGPCCSAVSSSRSSSGTSRSGLGGGTYRSWSATCSS